MSFTEIIAINIGAGILLGLILATVMSLPARLRAHHLHGQPDLRRAPRERAPRTASVSRRPVRQPQVG